MKKENENLLVDQFSRTISYLRLSLTDRCNLRCLYCMPDNSDTKEHLRGSSILERDELLSYEELLRIVHAAVSLGMNKVRLTGGEPLIRKGIMDFIHQLSKMDGLEDIRLTTNGVLLSKNCRQLYDSGVRNINISLDTLKRERFHEITGKDFFDRVWQGIQDALQIGFNIKINVVAMKGTNDDEFESFAELALLHPIRVRFIEFMPLGEKSRWKKDNYISAEEIIDRISRVGKLTSVKNSRFEGPARMYLLEGENDQRGKVGVISPISHHFCDQCNRLRLTSEGKLRACLLNDRETDLKKSIRNGCSDEDIKKMIRETIANKPKGHSLQDDLGKDQRPTCSGQMSKIGG